MSLATCIHRFPSKNKFTFCTHFKCMHSCSSGCCSTWIDDVRPKPRLDGPSQQWICIGKLPNSRCKRQRKSMTRKSWLRVEWSFWAELQVQTRPKHSTTSINPVFNQRNKEIVSLSFVDHVNMNFSPKFFMRSPRAHLIFVFKICNGHGRPSRRFPFDWAMLWALNQSRSWVIQESL